jgi:hypothetical protein
MAESEWPSVVCSSAQCLLFALSLNRDFLVDGFRRCTPPRAQQQCTVNFEKPWRFSIPTSKLAFSDLRTAPSHCAKGNPQEDAEIPICPFGAPRHTSRWSPVPSQRVRLPTISATERRRGFRYAPAISRLVCRLLKGITHGSQDYSDLRHAVEWSGPRYLGVCIRRTNGLKVMVTVRRLHPKTAIGACDPRPRRGRADLFTCEPWIGDRGRGGDAKTSSTRATLERHVGGQADKGIAGAERPSDRVRKCNALGPTASMLAARTIYCATSRSALDYVYRSYQPPARFPRCAARRPKGIRCRT